jgi:hypothetical protein
LRKKGNQIPKLKSSKEKKMSSTTNKEFSTTNKEFFSFLVSLNVKSADYGRDRKPGEAICIGESEGIVYADFRNEENFIEMFGPDAEGTTVWKEVATTFNRLQGWKDSVGDECDGKLANYVIDVVEQDIPEKKLKDLGLKVNVEFWRKKDGQECSNIYTEEVKNKKVTNKKSPTNPLAAKRAISKK